MHEPQTIGAIVESLIRTKDRHKGNLTMDQLEAINDACNILSHSFPQYLNKYDVVDDRIASVSWYRQDVRSRLHELGYEGTDAEIDTVLEESARLSRDIQNAMTAAGWEHIDARICTLETENRIQKKG